MVFGLAFKAAHKNQHTDVVQCEILFEMHCAQLL